MDSHRSGRTRAWLIGVLLLSGFAIFAASGCYSYGYPGYPDYGYAPYSWGWATWGYNPVFVVHHPWEDHYGSGHHDVFYHGAVGHAGGGFHAGGGGHGHK